MLKETTLFNKIDKVRKAIDRIKSFEPKEGYYFADSGGKDSGVCKKLLEISDVKYTSHHSLTTIDPPDLVYFLRQYHSSTIIEYPKRPFLIELIYRGFPQRQRRWCCEQYKEKGGSGRKVITGIRQAESPKRAKRKMVESCYKDTSKMYVNPIIDWSNQDVWEFTKKENIPYCKLYDEGWKRIGCLFCPMAGKHRLEELKRYPKYGDAFRRSFCKLYEYKKKRGLKSVDRWKDGSVMFDWWITENRTKEQPDQMVMFE